MMRKIKIDEIFRNNIMFINGRMVDVQKDLLMHMVNFTLASIGD